MARENLVNLQIVERLRQVRERAGISQAEFAKHMDVSRGAVGQYETGAASPGGAPLSNLCTSLGINGHWLLTGQGEMLSEKVSEVAQTEAAALRDHVSHLERELALSQGHAQSIPGRTDGHPQGDGTVLQRELSEIAALAQESRQDLGRKVLELVRATAVPLKRDDLRRLSDLTEGDIERQLLVLRRSGLIVEDASGIRAASPNLRTWGPADNSALAMRAVDMVVGDIVPAMDRDDGSGVLVIATVESDDGRTLANRLLRLVEEVLSATPTGKHRTEIVLGINQLQGDEHDHE